MRTVRPQKEDVIRKEGNGLDIVLVSDFSK